MLEIRELEKNQENFESKFSSFLISRNKISNEISVIVNKIINEVREDGCLLYTSPSPRDATLSRMPSSA